jgi:hypothetical protein
VWANDRYSPDAHISCGRAVLKRSGWLELESRLEPVSVAPAQAGTPTTIDRFNTATPRLSVWRGRIELLALTLRRRIEPHLPGRTSYAHLRVGRCAGCAGARGRYLGQSGRNRASRRSAAPTVGRAVTDTRLIEPMPNRRPGLLALLTLIACASGCVARHRACAPPELTRPSGLVQLGPADEPEILETDLIRSFADKAGTRTTRRRFRPGARTRWRCPAAGCTAPTRPGC